MITPDQSRFGLFTPTVVLFLLAYFVHRGSLSWIRISRDSREIVRVPSWFARKLIGEKQLVVQVPSGSELIFCRRLAYGGILGYYIIVRAPNGAEQIVWNDLTGVTRGRWSRVAKEIGERCQLPARVVTQNVSDAGTEETEWTAQTDSNKWKVMRIMVGPALAPFLGIVFRLFTSRARLLFLMGAVLWILSVGIFWYLYRTQEVSKEQAFPLMVFTWTIQFTTFYVLAVLVTGAVLSR